MNNPHLQTVQLILYDYLNNAQAMADSMKNVVGAGKVTAVAITPESVQMTSLSYPGQVYDKWVKAGSEKSLTTVPLATTIIALISTANQQIESKAADYFTSNLAKIIMAKDDATFNSVKASMIAAVKAMGLEAADAEYQKNYEAAKTVAESFK